MVTSQWQLGLRVARRPLGLKGPRPSGNQGEWSLQRLVDEHAIGLGVRSLETTDQGSWHRGDSGSLASVGLVRAAFLGVLILLGGPQACSIRPMTDSKSDAEEAARLFSEYWHWSLEQAPESASSLGYRQFDNRWTDYQFEAIEARYQKLGEFKHRLDHLLKRDLTDEDRRSAEILLWRVSTDLQYQRFHADLFPVTQLWGPQIEIPQLFASLQLSSDKDFQNYLERLQKIPVLINQITNLMEEGISKSLVLPKVAAARIPEQLKNLLEAPSPSHPIIKPLLEAASSDQANFKVEAENLLVHQVLPAFQEFYDFLQKRYIPASRDSVAWSDLPNGRQWYAALVKDHLSFDLSAKEIHEIGLREVARIRALMEQSIQEVGQQMSIPQFNQYLSAHPDFQRMSEQKLLNLYRDLGKKADERIAPLFSRLPRLGYEIRAVPAESALSMPAGYYQPGSLELGRPGRFFANPQSSQGVALTEAEALLLHEAVPGHHLQIALAQELQNIPEFRKHLWITAYGEGWALYAERLGEEMGFYQDPYSRFGRYRMEILRAARLVVDTGLHELGWTREEAMKFLEDNYGDPLEVEVDRYLVLPAQALAYKLGELKILELRQKYEKKLGDRFSIQDFHAAVLHEGCLPLELLEKHLERELGR